MANPVKVSNLADLVPAFAVDTRLLRTIIAKGYQDASMAEANMRRVVEQLETIRSAASTCGHIFELFDVLSDLIALALDDAILVGIVQSVRQNVHDAAMDAVGRQFDSASEHGPNERYAAALAAAVCYWGRRMTLAIVERRPPETVIDPTVSRVAQWRLYIQQEQAGYFSELLRPLASITGVDPATRVKALVLAARIETYQYEATGSAKQILDQATALAPADPAVISAYGEYWLQIGQKRKAEDAYKRAIELDPRFVPAYVAYGDFFQRQSEWLAAEEQYNRAISVRPGDTTSYRSLIDLYGRPELFNDRVDRLRLLAERAVIIDPDSALDVFGSAGSAHQQNGKYDEARSYFDRAVHAAPEVASPHSLLSRMYAERQDYTSAEAEIQRAIEMAPEVASFEFERGALYLQQERLADALPAFERAICDWSPWLTTFAPFAADIKWKLGARNEAVDDLVKQLADYPGSDALLTKLHEFVTSAYTDVKDVAMAAAILHRIREIEGEGYEARYRNRLGNMYYELKDFTRAAAEYERACAADAVTAVYRTNLALAYRGLRQWDKAREQLTNAFNLDRAQDEYDRQVADLLNDQALVHISRNEYTQAMSLYREATRLSPQSAVLHANAAYVLERLETPDRRLPELSDAISELEVAIKLGDNPEYHRRLADLRARRDLVVRYGPPGADMPLSRPILIEVGEALEPLVNSEKDGGTFLFELVPAMRERVEKDTGIPVPGVLLRANYGLDRNSLKVFTNEVGVALLSFPDSATGSALIQGIEGVIRRHMEDLVGLDSADAILRRWASEKRVPAAVAVKLGDTDFFVGLARVLRTLARERVPLLDAEAILGGVEGSSLSATEIPTVVTSVRQRLKRVLAGNGPDSAIVRLPPDVESMLTAAAEERNNAYDLPSRLRQTALTTLAGSRGGDSGPWTLVVSNPTVRLLLAQLVRSRLPNVTVLAEAELAETRQATT